MTPIIAAYGPNLLEHCALKQGYSVNMKLSQCSKTDDDSQLVEKLYGILVDAEKFIETFNESPQTNGFIFGKPNESDVTM